MCCGDCSNLCLEHNYGFFFCVRLLNLAWPRSRGSELRSLLSVDSAIDTQLPSDLQQNGGRSRGQFSLSTKLQSGWVNSEFCQKLKPNNHFKINGEKLVLRVVQLKNSTKGWAGCLRSGKCKNNTDSCFCKCLRSRF